MIENVHPDGEPTPTVADLVNMGRDYAQVIEWSGATKGSRGRPGKPGKPSKVRIMPKGHQLLGEIMKRNAKAALARGSLTEEMAAAVARARSTKEKE